MSEVVIGMTDVIQDRARERIRAATVQLAEQKNVPVTFQDREVFTEGVLGAVGSSHLSGLAQAPPSAVQDQLRWYLNNLLDSQGAKDLVRRFHHAAGFPEFLGVVMGRLHARTMYMVKGDNPADGPTVIWPTPEAVRQAARRAFAGQRPRDPDELEAALIVALDAWGLRRFAAGHGLADGGPSDLSLYDPAYERVWDMLTDLAELKNVPLSPHRQYAMADSVLWLVSVPDLHALARGTAPAELQTIHWRLNYELDCFAAQALVEVFERIGRLPALTGEDFQRLLKTIVATIKGDNRIGPPAVIWPEPSEMIAAARRAFPQPQRRTTSELEAALVAALEVWGLKRFAVPPSCQNIDA